MIKTTVKMSLNFPLLNTQEQLEKIALQVIVPDIQANMSAGVDINGSAHKSNVESTRKWKIRKGLRTSPPLIASGQLFSSPRVTFVGDNAVSIMPRGMRRPYPGDKTGGMMTNTELADILQNQGGRNSGHRYEFFGISRKAEQEAIKFMFRYIEKAIKDGKQRFIR